MQNIFTLSKQAKSKGGDMYKFDECTVYIPQQFSRKNGVVHNKLFIGIYNKELENSMVFELKNKAKKLGGDKYVCKDNESFNMYIPQHVSRKDGDKDGNVAEKFFIKIEDGDAYSFVKVN